MCAGVQAEARASVLLEDGDRHPQATARAPVGLVVVDVEVRAVTAVGALGLRGPRHRTVPAGLIVVRRRVVPVSRLVADRWDDPPPGAVGAVRPCAAALRRVLEAERLPQAPGRRTPFGCSRIKHLAEVSATPPASKHRALSSPRRR